MAFTTEAPLSLLLRPGRALISAAFVLLFVAACSSTTSPGAADASANVAPATCASPGAAASGPADTHCMGVPVQPTHATSCMPNATGLPSTTPPVDAGPVLDAGDAGAVADAGPPAVDCDYGATMNGQSADDDDCKYAVSWTSTQICEGSVNFTVTVKNLGTNAPESGIPQGLLIETFQPTDPKAACDTVSTHPGPNTGGILTETAAGSGVYSGPVVFDLSGLWTVRFHIHEECADTLEDSPHGHAAFHINVP